MSNKRKHKAPVKKRSGPLPDILRKGTPHPIRTRYKRKQKHGNKDYSE